MTSGGRVVLSRGPIALVRVALAIAAMVLALGAARAEEVGFELVRGAPATVRVGEAATISLSIVPSSGHRLLAEGPLEVRLTGERLRLPRALYLRDDAVDPRADVPRFELKLIAERAGSVELRARCRFYLCKGDRCRPVESELLIPIDVASVARERLR